MPKVNGKKFPYTIEGKAAAARARKKQAMADKKAKPKMTTKKKMGK
jgi:hypothetical protein